MQKEQKKKGLILWWVSAMGALLLMSGVALYFYSNSENNSYNINTTINTKNTVTTKNSKASQDNEQKKLGTLFLRVWIWKDFP